jgi:transcriptional regulator with XRE-family HTH domain
MTVGQRIRDRRKALGYTQKQLGELCGMADSAIRKYESGKIAPKHSTLAKIAHALQIPVLALSDINIEVDTDGSGGASFNLNQIHEDAIEKVTELKHNPNCRIGVIFKDDGEKQALEYLLEHGKTSPEWTNRLITAFNQLDFQRQQMLVSTAEFWILEHKLLEELDELNTSKPQDAEG